ncbi:hypothetical protein D9611_008974 [Ephemerocybe angulata]|uniref:F-box domain-containing protein n=1 Tax=Ephemerocybe angulata TaxID=980116 RepID=A0A8H5FCG1_9AGAR|nr:hypothetical protein D9611_008974 [Tulosesus angulatus]
MPTAKAHSALNHDIIIPNELWCEAFTHLEPFEVLSLGQVSRAFHALISEKSVWITILRTVCDKHKLFKPSYPVHEMDLVQLQRAALGPRLVRQCLTRGGVPTEYLAQANEVRPVSTLRLKVLSQASLAKPLEPGVLWLHRRHLVPGGRFLIQVRFNGLKSNQEVIEATGTTYFVELWDLGVSGSAPLENPILLTQTEFEKTADHNVYSITASFYGSAQEGLRVAIAFTDVVREREGDVCAVKILSLLPGDDQPRFQVTTEIEIKRHPESYTCEAPSQPHFRGNLLFIPRGRQILLIWDFILGIYTRMDLVVQGNGSPDKASCGFVSDTSKQQEIYVWKVPSRGEFQTIASHNILLPRDPDGYGVPGAPQTYADQIVQLPQPMAQGYGPRLELYFSTPDASAELPLSFDIFHHSQGHSALDPPGFGPGARKLPRTSIHGLRCTLGHASSTESDDAPLMINVVASFMIQPPVSGYPFPPPTSHPRSRISPTSDSF